MKPVSSANKHIRPIHNLILEIITAAAAETNESNQLAATPDVKVNPVCWMELLSSALDFSASEEADEFARGEDGDSEVGGEETKPRKKLRKQIFNIQLSC